MSSAVASAQQNQFWLAAQHDWGGKKGFFLTLGAQAPPGTPAGLENVKLELGLGDGTNWRFVSAPSKWQYNTSYTAKMIVASGVVEVSLDGQRLERMDAAIAPVTTPMAACEQPSFLRGPASYIIRQTRLLARSADTTI